MYALHTVQKPNQHGCASAGTDARGRYVRLARGCVVETLRVAAPALLVLEARHVSEDPVVALAGNATLSRSRLTVGNTTVKMNNVLDLPPAPRPRVFRLEKELVAHTHLGFLTVWTSLAEPPAVRGIEPAVQIECGGGRLWLLCRSADFDYSLTVWGGGSVDLARAVQLIVPHERGCVVVSAGTMHIVRLDLVEVPLLVHREPAKFVAYAQWDAQRYVLVAELGSTYVLAPLKRTLECVGTSTVATLLVHLVDHYFLALSTQSHSVVFSINPKVQVCDFLPSTPPVMDITPIYTGYDLVPRLLVSQGGIFSGELRLFSTQMVALGSVSTTSVAEACKLVPGENGVLVTRTDGSSKGFNIKKGKLRPHETLVTLPVVFDRHTLRVEALEHVFDEEISAVDYSTNSGRVAVGFWSGNVAFVENTDSTLHVRFQKRVGDGAVSVSLHEEKLFALSNNTLVQINLADETQNSFAFSLELPLRLTHGVLFNSHQVYLLHDYSILEVHTFREELLDCCKVGDYLVALCVDGDVHVGTVEDKMTVDTRFETLLVRKALQLRDNVVALQTEHVPHGDRYTTLTQVALFNVADLYDHAGAVQLVERPLADICEVPVSLFPQVDQLAQAFVGVPETVVGKEMFCVFEVGRDYVESHGWVCVDVEVSKDVQLNGICYCNEMLHVIGNTYFMIKQVGGVWCVQYSLHDMYYGVASAVVNGDVFVADLLHGLCKIECGNWRRFVHQKAYRDFTAIEAIEEDEQQIVFAGDARGNINVFAVAPPGREFEATRIAACCLGAQINVMKKCKVNGENVILVGTVTGGIYTLSRIAFRGEPTFDLSSHDVSETEDGDFFGIIPPVSEPEWRRVCEEAGDAPLYNQLNRFNGVWRCG